jgi:hypothetical protein
VPGLEECNKIARQNVLLGELLAITEQSGEPSRMKLWQAH